MNASEITDKLGLHSLRHRGWVCSSSPLQPLLPLYALAFSLIRHVKKQYIQSTCATSGDGLYEGLEWLATTLRKAGHQ